MFYGLINNIFEEESYAHKAYLDYLKNRKETYKENRNNWKSFIKGL